MTDRAREFHQGCTGAPIPERLAQGWREQAPRRALTLFLFLFSLTLLGSARSLAVSDARVNDAYVDQKAKKLAEDPYDDDWGRTPDFLRNLDYDAYREIRFDRQKALWSDANLPFRIEFFHPGGIYTRAVKIHEFTAEHTQELRFATDFFDYGTNKDLARRIPASLGYAGFGILCRLDVPDRFDEFAVFLGSSYFRMVGRGQQFGLSARGLALNTLGPGAEEFPAFREYWLGKPQPNDETLVVYALLDSASVTGAYRFEIRPGDETAVAVRATLHFRKAVANVGLAPISSMFYFGKDTMAKPADYRGEVHDSDGLLLRQPDGGYVWHPLVNPPTSATGQYSFATSASFGLCQREDEFDRYQDILAAYEARPSLWVEPGSGPWAPGRAVLYQFHAPTEADDNIVAYWRPDAVLAPGATTTFEYTLHYMKQGPLPDGRVVSTRVGRHHPYGLQPKVSPPPGAEEWECVVDFAGETLEKQPPVAKVEPVVETGAGVRIAHVSVEKNPHNKTWRLILQFGLVAGSEDRGIRARLQLDGRPVSETWDYTWVE